MVTPTALTASPATARSVIGTPNMSHAQSRHSPWRRERSRPQLVQHRQLRCPHRVEIRPTTTWPLDALT